MEKIKIKQIYDFIDKECEGCEGKDIYFKYGFLAEMYRSLYNIVVDLHPEIIATRSWLNYFEEEK